MFQSFAQNFEDVILWRALGHVTNGRYVDVGAADPRAAAQVSRHELTGLFREIQQDRAGFEHTHRIVAAWRIMIHNRRHPVVWADLQKLGRKLIPRADVHWNGGIRQPHFLQRDGYFPAIRGGPIVEVNHFTSPNIDP